MTTTGTAVAAKKDLTPRELLKKELDRFTPSYAKLLPKGRDPGALITGAMVAIQDNQDLMKCTPISIATSLARIAQWNLEIGVTAHLVPYGTKCTPIADYKGLIRLMLRSNAWKVEAHAVRQGEPFEYRFGLDPHLTHQPLGNTSAPIVAAYAVVWLKSGAKQFEVMTIEQIDKIRLEKSFQWKKGPCPEFYARKTVVRQLAKYIEMTPQLAAAMANDGDLVDPETGEVTNAGLLSAVTAHPEPSPAAAPARGDADESLTDDQYLDRQDQQG